MKNNIFTSISGKLHKKSVLIKKAGYLNQFTLSFGLKQNVLNARKIFP